MVQGRGEAEPEDWSASRDNEREKARRHSRQGARDARRDGGQRQRMRPWVEVGWRTGEGEEEGGGERGEEERGDVDKRGEGRRRSTSTRCV